MRERKDWKTGRLEDWKTGRLEDWKDGRMDGATTKKATFVACIPFRWKEIVS